jgi:hypothetical protein
MSYNFYSDNNISKIDHNNEPINKLYSDEMIPVSSSKKTSDIKIETSILSDEIFPSLSSKKTTDIKIETSILSDELFPPLSSKKTPDNISSNIYWNNNIEKIKAPFEENIKPKIYIPPISHKNKKEKKIKIDEDEQYEYEYYNKNNTENQEEYYDEEYYEEYI